MNFENCPNWVCDVRGIPYDYVYFLTGVFMAIPYLLLVRYLYKKRQMVASEKEGCLFLLAVPIGYVIYCSILFFALIESKNVILSFIGGVNYAPVITLTITVPILIIAMLIVWFTNFEKWKKK